MWLTEIDVAAEFCVDATGHLVAICPPGAIEWVIKRGAKAALVPPGRAVSLFDQDVISVKERILRIHIHGETSSIIVPTAFAMTQRPPAPPERWEAALRMGAQAQAKQGRTSPDTASAPSLVYPEKCIHTLAEPRGAGQSPTREDRALATPETPEDHERSREHRFRV